MCIIYGVPRGVHVVLVMVMWVLWVRVVVVVFLIFIYSFFSNRWLCRWVTLVGRTRWAVCGQLIVCMGRECVCNRQPSTAQ